MRPFKHTYLVTVTGEWESDIACGDKAMEERSIAEAIAEPLVGAMSEFWQTPIEEGVVTVQERASNERPMTVADAVKQLERSERGQMTCKMLRDFLRSQTIQGLDGSNSAAVTFLIKTYMLGGSEAACSVVDSLHGTVQRHRWTETR